LHLQDLGIPLFHELPGVGQNLQDHITTVLIYKTQKINDAMGFSLKGAWNMLKAVLEWRSKRTGWITSNVSETQGFVSTEGNNEYPNIQLALCTGIVDDHARKMHAGHGYTLHVTLMRPQSRGSLTLASRNPTDAPLIDPAFFKESADMQTLVTATQLGLPTIRRKLKAFCVTTPTPNTTLWALAKWGLRMIRWPWSMPNFAFMACKICASSMRPSCRTW
jgi:choline dehydrogenase